MFFQNESCGLMRMFFYWHRFWVERLWALHGLRFPRLNEEELAELMRLAEPDAEQNVSVGGVGEVLGGGSF